MIDAGKAYNTANKQFVNGIRELAQQSATDDVIEVHVDVQVMFFYLLVSETFMFICPTIVCPV